jgi:hypothetical protein
MSIMILTKGDMQVVRCTDCPDWRSEVPVWGLVVANYHNIVEHDRMSTILDKRDGVCA